MRSHSSSVASWHRKSPKDMPGQNQLMKRVLIGLTQLAAIQTPEVLGLDGADAVLTNLGMSRCARERGWLTKQGEKEFASQLLATGQSLGQLTIADFEEVMKLSLIHI